MCVSASWPEASLRVAPASPKFEQIAACGVDRLDGDPAGPPDGLGEKAGEHRQVLEHERHDVVSYACCRDKATSTSQRCRPTSLNRMPARKAMSIGAGRNPTSIFLVANASSSRDSSS